MNIARKTNTAMAVAGLLIAGLAPLVMAQSKPAVELEAAIAKLELVPGRHFAAVRRDIRGFIAESEAGRDVEALVEELLS